MLLFKMTLNDLLLENTRRLQDLSRFSVFIIFVLMALHDLERIASASDHLLCTNSTFNMLGSISMHTTDIIVRLDRNCFP